MTWQPGNPTWAAMRSEGGDFTHQGAAHSALTNTAPESFTTRRWIKLDTPDPGESKERGRPAKLRRHRARILLPFATH